MRIIAVDDEKYALMDLEEAIKKVDYNNEVYSFQFTSKALEFVGEQISAGKKIDVAFLDVEMIDMTGIELAKRLKDIIHDIKIIFVTGYSQYAIDAFELHASGYLLKPVSADKVREEIDNIKSINTYKSHNRVRVQTFGNFELFVDDKPVVFSRAKSKELFAFLVDRKGSNVTLDEIIAVLWEDREDSSSLKNQIRVIISDLNSTLKSLGLQNIIIKSRNNIALDTSNIQCDFYDFLKGDVQAINSYTGEYMSAYSWAEMTAGYLSNQ